MRMIGLRKVALVGVRNMWLGGKSERFSEKRKEE